MPRRRPPRRGQARGAAELRYFYDTEFIDNGRTIELISIGVAAEDGRMLAEGRAVVVLNTPLAAAAQESTPSP